MPRQAFLIDLAAPAESKSGKEFRSRELQELISSVGNLEIFAFDQIQGLPNYRTFLEADILDRVISEAAKADIHLLVINNILKPQQTFALTEILRPYRIEVWDRIDLILQIFSAHANTAEAKLQIELARIRHMGPRIFGMGEELSRQGGGIGTSGIGETNLEIMRRHLKEQERRVLGKLKKVEQTKSLQREQRRRQSFQTVALVGYTNAGKSTLMQRLTKKANITVDDALFVTLDTRIGRLFLPAVLKNVLLSDTIGFIADLPPQLIAAFHSTLSEAIHADLLLHVVDVSDSEREYKISVVDKILEDLGLAEKPQILVFNKLDRVQRNFGKMKLQKKYKSRTPVFVSATEKENLDELKKRIGEILF